ncbi:hypothetical protein ABPG74_015173 [Tetrahymena malaccensis]
MNPKVVNLKDNSKGARLKSIFGIIFYFYCSYILCTSLLCYLLYQTIVHKSVVALVIIIIVCTYQYGFAKKSETLISFFRYMNLPNYFNEWTCTLEEPVKENKALLSYHPHCIFNFTFLWNSVHNCYNQIFLASRMLLNVPFLGIAVKLMGVQSVDPGNLARLMKQGKNIGILPGAFEEACLTSQYEHRIYIKHRKGFIKYALKYGYTIYPCYSFGENQVYWTFTKFLKFRMILAKMKMLSVLFGSRFGIAPHYDVAMHSVVGKGIQCPQIENPSKEDVEKYHKIYVDAIVNLFNKYKKQFNLENQELILY